MKRIVALACVVAGGVITAACSESSSPNGSALLLDASSAFTTVPAGFSDLNTSFAPSLSDGPFQPSFNGRGPGDRMHWSFGRGPGFGIGFMGGLGGPFLGLGLLDFWSNRSCTFSSGTVTCEHQTRGGLTINQTFKFTDSNGNSQSKIDTTTNTIVSSVTVSGTVSGRGDIKSDVNESSNQTIGGLAKGSTKRTIDGASKALENTSGTSDSGSFTATRTAGDTITGVVIPIGSAATSHPPYPTAGKIIRSMSVTMTLNGQSPASSTRREVITYDGSATAKVVITEDGTTQNCTLPLPFGHLSCQ